MIGVPRDWRAAAATAACIAAVLASRRHLASSAAAALAMSREEQLGALWSGAMEVIELSSSERCFMSPLTTAPSTARRISWPLELRTHAVFALTAFDPPSRSARSLAENTRANAAMYSAIAALGALRCYQSYGFDIGSGVEGGTSWREDGFTLLFPRADADAAREAVLAIARQFEQGAIFEYAPVLDDDSETLLVRTTLPALSVDAVREDVLVTRLESSALFAARAHGNSDVLVRPWAGPAAVA
jgi:hypothetical protein